MQHTVKIPVAPCPKPRMTRSDKWKNDPDHIDPKKRKRPAVVRYHQFKDDLAKEITGTLDAQFSVVFHVGMPKSWSEKKKAAFDGQPHQVKPDADNYLKALMDALCEDDSYIYDVRVQKYWAYEGSITIIEERD